MNNLKSLPIFANRSNSMSIAAAWQSLPEQERREWTDALYSGVKNAVAAVPDSSVFYRYVPSLMREAEKLIAKATDDDHRFATNLQNVCTKACFLVKLATYERREDHKRRQSDIRKMSSAVKELGAAHHAEGMKKTKKRKANANR